MTTRLTDVDYRTVPWRNGGGTTKELLVRPEGMPVGEAFLYRLSIADVATSGPFSRFPGYDRHIMLLEGEGMTLDCGAHGRIDLTEPLAPRSFSGDWEVTGALRAGPVRDFNLIVDRARATSALEVRHLEQAWMLLLAPGETCAVHVLEGALEGAAAGDTLLTEEPVELVPAPAARIAVARIVLR